MRPTPPGCRPFMLLMQYQDGFHRKLSPPAGHERWLVVQYLDLFVVCDVLTSFKVTEYNELLGWLEPKGDTVSLESIAEDICPGTRTAILDSSPYMDWRDSQRSQGHTKPLWACGPRTRDLPST